MISSRYTYTRLNVHVCFLPQYYLLYNFILMQSCPPRHIDIPDMPYQDQSELCSPRMQQRSSLFSNSNITPHLLQRCNLVSQFQHNFLLQILQKTFNTRTHNENRFINEFIKKNQALKQLSDINGREYCKGIMRTAVLEEFAQHEIIEDKDAQVNTVYLIVEGKAGSIKNQNQSDMIEHINQREVYELLMNASRKESKKISKLTRRFSSFREYNHRSHQKYQTTQDTQYLEVFQKGQSFADKTRCFNRVHPHTIIALQPTVILSVDVKNVIFWLNHAFQLKLQKLSKILTSHPFFSYLDNEIIEQIISYMSAHKRKKNEVVYSQGQQSAYIYFLEEGQLKIQKQCHLFLDNPNELYMDRRKLMTSRERDNNQYLPYANFEHLYNYRPINKTIQLGILTPFALFGQEEIVQGKKRQTTIRCSSLAAVYYSIEIKRIYQILNTEVTSFLTNIQNSIKDKIKYRQTSYATTINLENKTNLKYFYYEGQRSLPTPRKYKIKKINEKITQNSTAAEKEMQKDMNTAHTQSSHETQYFNPQSRPFRHQSTDKQFQSSIPPFYNTFNFHKMLKTKLVKQQLTKVTLQEHEEELVNVEQNTYKSAIKEQLKKQESIIANSHTWRLVREKVKQESRLSKKIGSYKHDINFVTPLIDSKYFHNIETQMKRIQRQQKAGKFNVSLPKKRNRTFSLNTITIDR